MIHIQQKQNYSLNLNSQRNVHLAFVNALNQRSAVWRALLEPLNYAWEFNKQQSKTEAEKRYFCYKIQTQAFVCVWLYSVGLFYQEEV